MTDRLLDRVLDLLDLAIDLVTLGQYGLVRRDDNDPTRRTR